MSRKFIAGVLAASMTVTTLAANAADAQQYQYQNRGYQQSQQDAFGQFIAGAAVLAITGLILNDVMEDKRKSPKKTTSKKTTVKKAAPKKVHSHKPKKIHKPKQSRMPAHCLRRVAGSNKGKFYGRRCVNKNYTGARRLPDQCLRFYRTQRGKVAGYGRRCMRERGFNVAY